MVHARAGTDPIVDSKNRRKESRWNVGSNEMPPTRKEKRPKDYGEPEFVSEQYAVYPDYPYVLFIAKDAEVPVVVKRDMGKAPDMQGRRPHIYRYKFTSEDNDCLQFAESLAKGEVHYSSEECVYRVKGSKRQFGDTDKQNIELAKKYKANDKADPRKGQSYAIVRTNLKEALQFSDEDLPPYHIAFVLVEDGEFRITLEADAGAVRRKPVFGIYSVRPSHPKTFHKTYKEMYGMQAAATIVLEPKDNKDKEEN